MIWKSAASLGFSKYEVSEFGDVRHIVNGPIQQDFNIKGYKRVTLWKSYKGYKRFLVHRIVALLFVPNPLVKPVVNHDDEDIHNNYWRNLRWMTYTENVQYSIDIRHAEAKKDCPF